MPKSVIFYCIGNHVMHGKTNVNTNERQVVTEMYMMPPLLPWTPDR